MEGYESAHARGRSIGGASVTDDHVLSMALHLRDQELSLRDVAGRLFISKETGWHPSPTTASVHCGFGWHVDVSRGRNR